MDAMKLQFKKPWAYAVDGVDILEFSAGAHTVRADIAKQALKEGVALEDKPIQHPVDSRAKAKGGSPSNKAKSGPSTAGSTKSSASGKK